MPVAVAVGNLWFVWAIDCNVNVANRTSHKFPAATATGVPCEVKLNQLHAASLIDHFVHSSESFCTF